MTLIPTCSQVALFSAVLLCVATPVAAQTTVVSCGQVVSGTTLACADPGACDQSLVTSAETCEVSYHVESGIPGSSLGVCTLD
jgi:hypothetical protein